VPRHPIVIVAFVMLATGTTISAQQGPSNQADSVRLSRYGSLLREDHIELTEPALLRALKNPNPEVRFLAAMKLAEDKVSDAIPGIKEALESERVPRTRVNIALALGLLGDSRGRDELKTLCSDRSFPPEFRLYAVRYMFDLHDEKGEGCLRAAEEIVKVVGDYHTIDYRITALNLLPQFRGLTPKNSQKVFELVVGRLDDPEPTVRMQAGQSIVELGDPAAANYLQDAIAREKEEAVRNVLLKSLENLEGHPEKVTPQ